MYACVNLIYKLHGELTLTFMALTNLHNFYTMTNTKGVEQMIDSSNVFCFE